MKLTGKKLYKGYHEKTVEEIGLIVFAYSELNPKQKTLYKKAGISGEAFLVATRKDEGWDIEKRDDKECLKEIILDNFPNFNFNEKYFWFYEESNSNINDLFFVKQVSSSIMKNE